MQWKVMKFRKIRRWPRCYAIDPAIICLPCNETGMLAGTQTR
jgi:hypothetical protein